MSCTTSVRAKCVGLVFGLVFGLGLTAGAAMGLAGAAEAASAPNPALQSGNYGGPDFCLKCHDDIHALWKETRHAQAFSSPIFQRDWTELGTQTECLRCHTTGYDPATGTYATEGVTCEACHGPFQPNHPQQPMPLKPDASLCATCHKSTTDEWRASPHSQADVQCQACHNPHAQRPKAESVTALCSNCHKDPGASFTHGTHADAGLECSNCHMFSAPRFSDPIGGLVATGHTFSVGSEACIGCHQDTVHTRDKILALSGEVSQLTQEDPQALRQTIEAQREEIKSLEQQKTVRLYTGLAQGAIVGLLMGGAAAWVVSRRIRVVEVDEDEQQATKD